MCGCRNKWRGATMGPRGRGRALDRHGQVLAPLLCSQCQIFSNIPEKSYFNFGAFGELLFLGYFYIAWIIQKTDI